MCLHLFLASALGVLASGDPVTPRGDDPKAEQSQVETEKLVKADLASRLKVAADSLTVVEAVERNWPDQRLGCAGRRGLEEPVPVPGYAFVLEASGQKHSYHADRHGRFVRCDTPKKRLGPVMR